MRSLILTLCLLLSFAAHAQMDLLEDLVRAAESRGLPRDMYLDSEALSAQQISELALKISSDLYRGHILPTDISDRVRIPAKKFIKQAEVQKYLNRQITLNDLFLQIEPKNTLYVQQLKILNHLKAMKDSGWANAPRSGNLPLLKIGVNAPNTIKYLRARLANLGYENDITNPTFDIELAALVMSYQTDHKLESDGVVGSNSWLYLNRDITQ
ncbi:MAG: peptidoglycan-binding protein, partial [Pseudobdellovibrio sp.]